MPDSGKWRESLESAKYFSNSGEDRKALKILETALENYPQQKAQIWLSYRKAILLLKMEGLEAARELVMDLLAPDSPINNLAKAELRHWVIKAMSEANDVEGLAVLLPDQLLCDASHTMHKRAVLIAKRHNYFSDSESITPGAKPPSQSVLSERSLSYRIPAKTRYPTRIKQCLDGEKSYAPAVSLYTLTNCTAIFWNGYAFFFDAAGGFIHECSNFIPPALMNVLIKNRLKDPVPTIPGVSAYIGDRFQNANYCHWILDWLPRLSLCERAAPFDNIVSIRLEADFMRESLAFLGYQDKTIIAVGNTPYVWRFETLLVPNSPLKPLKAFRKAPLQGLYKTRPTYHPMHYCHPDLLQWWRSRCPARKPHRKLYIPRLSKRVVLNEKDLLGLLEGFEVFDPGQHSFAKQIKMFSEAEMIVGAHGAGLTNLLFAPEGCRVLELFPGMGGTPAYFCLANALNHDYDLIMAEGPSPPPGEREANDLSFTVPLEQVGQWLQGNA